MCTVYWRPWETVSPSIQTIDHNSPYSVFVNSPTYCQLSPSSSSGTSQSSEDLPSPKRKCSKCTCPNCIEKKVDPTDGKRVHICNFEDCRKTYQKTSHLKAHIRSHIGYRPFTCPWNACSRSFARSDQLRRHLRGHTGERRHSCSECSRTFSRSDHLKQHKASRHPLIVVD